MNIYINKELAKEALSPATDATTAQFQPALPANQLEKPTRLLSRSAKSPEPSENELVHQIDMKNKSEAVIWQEVQTLTNAALVTPSPGEMQTLKELDDKSKEAQISSERGKSIRAAVKKEQDMLKAAAEQFAASRGEEASA